MTSLGYLYKYVMIALQVGVLIQTAAAQSNLYKYVMIALQVGILIQTAAAQSNLKRCSLELGGKVQ